MPFPFHRLGRALRPTAKPARDKGVRSTGARRATHPCGAPGASGSEVILVFSLSLFPSCASRSWVAPHHLRSDSYERSQMAERRLAIIDDGNDAGDDS
jgi:hypothetical protein